jgi:hypothetical protein
LSAFGLPFLRVTLSGANVVVSWQSNLAGFGLESTSNLSSGIWTPVGGAVLSGGRFQVTVPATTSPQFFRLKK